MRSHVHHEVLPGTQVEVFDLLTRASSIRQWWGASTAIVVPQEGGIWTAAWGDDEDRPAYVTVATIGAFEYPHRLLLNDYKYWSLEGAPASEPSVFVTEFTVTSCETKATLVVKQTGFAEGPAGDSFYSACETGWQEVFRGIRKFLLRT